VSGGAVSARWFGRLRPVSVTLIVPFRAGHWDMIGRETA
jgi:hypothetical protein